MPFDSIHECLYFRVVALGVNLIVDKSRHKGVSGEEPHAALRTREHFSNGIPIKEPGNGMNVNDSICRIS